jgi:PPOX class probable F420-dependent enzyme
MGGHVMPFDPKVEAAASIVRRLEGDEIGWVVTTHKGTPRPVPVWFLWDGDRTVLIYSARNALKVKSAAADPRSAFHFNSDEHGGEVAILYGQLAHRSGTPPMIENERYMTKYREALKAYTADMKTTEEAVSAEFSVALHFLIDDSNAW